MPKNKSPKVLIIDDDLLLNRMYQLILQEAGYKVICALNGDEGLEKAVEAKPDLILLDIVIPGKDGIQVLEEIRRRKELKKVPVICLTVMDDKKVIQKCYSLGASDYIVKQETTPDQVVSKVVLRLNHSGHSL